MPWSFSRGCRLYADGDGFLKERIDVITHADRVEVDFLGDLEDDRTLDTPDRHGTRVCIDGCHGTDWGFRGQYT